MRREKKNIVLIIIFTVLVILVLGAVGYLIYSTTLSSNNNQVDTSDTDNSELIDTIKGKFYLAYTFFNASNSYCGPSTSSNYKKPDELSDYSELDPVLKSNGCYISNDFTSYSEMKDYLEKNLSENLIDIKENAKESYYIEVDDRLCCANLGKGGLNTYGNEEVELIEVTSNQVRANASIEITDATGNKTKDVFNLVLDKVNDNWIISSYEKQN